MVRGASLADTSTHLQRAWPVGTGGASDRLPECQGGIAVVCQEARTDHHQQIETLRLNTLSGADHRNGLLSQSGLCN